MIKQDSTSSKSRIEDAAREEFASHGYHGARIDRIAERAGLNKQLIYYYFGSKQKLHEHVLQQESELLRFEPSMRRSLQGAPSDRLRSLLKTALDRIVSTPGLARSALAGEDAAPGAAAAAQALDGLATDIGREISRGQGLGYYRDDADPALLGKQAVSLLMGWCLLSGTPGGRPGPDADAWADAAADLLSRSLTW